ncbi:energy transducer TonB [Calditerrivibrio nitroreducens]|uniref:energy transducer TonB n=3 Tax=Calditerrivibrio TaxID=545865 RepID=UPI003C74E5BE
MKRLNFFLVISFVVHLIFLYSIKLPSKDDKQKKEPIYVDVIKKVPKNQNQLKQPDKFLPKPQPSILKKPTYQKPSNKIIPDSFSKKETPIIPPIKGLGKNDQKNVVEEKKDEQHQITPKETPHNPTKEDVKEIKPQDQSIKTTEKPSEEKRSLNKDQLSKILNPKDIINEIAKKEQKKEDEVDFNRFEVKYTSYFYKFKQRLYNVWRYPTDSAMRGEQGTVRIKFSILKDGTITNINIVSSSGYSQLDRAAVEALKNMGKVPLPEAFGINILNVDGYFIYYISGMGIR